MSVCVLVDRHLKKVIQVHFSQPDPIRRPLLSSHDAGLDAVARNDFEASVFNRTVKLVVVELHDRLNSREPLAYWPLGAHQGAAQLSLDG